MGRDEKLKEGAEGVGSTQDAKTVRWDSQHVISRESSGGERAAERQYVAADGDGGYVASPMVGHGVIAVGGMGVVHRVHEPVLDRYVASKALRPERIATRVDDFLMEARILARLEHPNIVPVYGLGRSREGHLDRFQMKLVEGQSLQQRIGTRRDLPLSPSEITEFLEAFKQVCDALSFAHSRNVIHRDIKPDNIMMGPFGQVYVMDWGIALVKGERNESSDRVVGTPPYMAPEQFRGRDDDIDQRTDVYGLGATLYEFLTGFPPHPDVGEGDKLLEESREPLIPPDERAPQARIPAVLSDIAVRALQPDPSQRFQSVSELRDAIQRFLESGAWAERVPVVAGEIICRTGEPGDCVYLVESGTYAVVHDPGGEALRTLGPGDCFGELSLLLGKPRTATVIANSQGTLLRISSKVFDRALPKGSWLRNVTMTLAERFIEDDSHKK